ncbi:hypothetical protein [Marinobacter sp.]|uniref:hypothetical protein n=1 Tax=Marinobacter sp. TaxID=50741 RepID=UPI003567C5A9
MLRIFKLRLKGLKRLLSIALVIAVIATYTAYKGQVLVQKAARDALESVLSDMEVNRGVPAGQEIILAYNSAIESPTTVSIRRLYSMIENGQDTGDAVVRFSGNAIFPTPEIQAAFAYNMNQLRFVESPIISGASIFLVTAAFSYLIVIIYKASVAVVRWAFSTLRTRIA